MVLLDRPNQDWKRKFEKEEEQARPALEGALRKWQRTPDLAGVRDEQALAQLPEAEARAWRDLWRGVAELLARTT